MPRVGHMGRLGIRVQREESESLEELRAPEAKPLTPKPLNPKRLSDHFRKDESCPAQLPASWTQWSSGFLRPKVLSQVESIPAVGSLNYCPTRGLPLLSFGVMPRLSSLGLPTSLEQLGFLDEGSYSV